MDKLDKEVGFQAHVYRDDFSIRINERRLIVPAQQGANDNILVVPRISLKRLIEGIGRHMPVWVCDRRLHKHMYSDRTARYGPYAIWVDPERHETPDVDDPVLDPSSLTLQERLLLGHLHFRRVGEPLQSAGATLCLASQSRKTGVFPHVGWHRFKGELSIGTVLGRKSEKLGSYREIRCFLHTRSVAGY